MRLFLPTVGLFLFNLSVIAQFSGNVDSVYTFLKYNSICHKRVNWDTEDKLFYSNISKASTLDDTLNAFVQVLEALGDVHSSIIYNQRSYANWKATSDEENRRLTPMLSEASRRINKPEIKLIADHVLYVNLPGYNSFGTDQIQQQAQELHNALMEFNPDSLQGVIVDLRWNTGGNAYPMFAGLSALFGDGVLAYQIDADNNAAREWKLEKGALKLSETVVTNVNNPGDHAWSKLPVVVLTSPITLSSGSIVAIAFKGRECSISLGEPTGEGYTTCTNYFWFNEQLQINLAVHFMADRNGVVYEDIVSPDEAMVATNAGPDLKEDKIIQEALNRLVKGELPHCKH